MPRVGRQEEKKRERERERERKIERKRERERERIKEEEVVRIGKANMARNGSGGC